MDNQYTGDVAVGGPADTRELAGLTITKIAVGPYDNNAYLLRDRATGEGLLIDAANEPERLVELTRGGIGAILTTHLHADHWQALDAVRDATSATTLAGTADADEIPVPTDRRLQHGDTVRVGESQLAVVELRGHTPGSIALYYADRDSPDGHGHLFTGDALFPGGVGKTWSPEAFHSLIADVADRIFDVYDDRTWFYPGHGKDSTLGAERPRLPEWRERGW